MRILVTGGSGMVGHAIQKLTQNDKENEYVFIGSKDCDMRDNTQVMELFQANLRHRHPNYDMVIHLAAIVGGLYMNMNNNGTMLMDNLKININIIDACNKFNIKRAIFCLSSCVFPANASEYPMTEEMLNDSPPHESNEGYSYSKRMLAVLCKHYNEQFNREYICVSPVNLYGPYDNFHLEDSHVIPGLIHKMYRVRTSKDNELKIMGSGKALRQFVFVEDFATAILTILHDERINAGVINICDKKEYTIRDLVEKLAKLWSIPMSQITFDTQHSDGLLKKTVSNKKFMEYFPDFKFASLDYGLTRTIGWFIQNFDEARC